MGAGHSQGGSANDRNRKRLTIMLLLVASYMVAEVVGGLASGSLALVADAGHMFSDAAALALSLFAIWIAQRPPSPERSYGYFRTEILAALANGGLLVAASVLIFREAIQRLGQPPEVEGGLMTVVAVGGLAINLLGLWLLNEGKGESLNVKGAWLSVLADTLGSVGVLVGAALIWLFGWNWADPVISMFIAVLILFSAWQLLKEAVAVLMEGTPAHIEPDAVRNAMASVPGVAEVYDLHIWTITQGMDALSAHVSVERGQPSGPILQQLQDVLHERFGVDHATLQLEPLGFHETRKDEGRI